ncbi:MAG TPA: DUF4262 domain-containing protein [Cyclobacteriaceae bacterium]|nr:DUF4262 domain-containing protein [Cyclobacteriaceae bacterium]
MKTPHDDHNCRDHQKTIADIEMHGLTVIIIEATDYLPSFAYSIGLWKKFGHPELISFGLTIKTLHEIINLAADVVKSGQKLQAGKTYTDFFETGTSEFVEVDRRNLRDYFGYAIDFYRSADFPALQLVWTDRGNRFPWDKDFEEEFSYRQPLLDRNADFKFREPKNLVAFTTRQWLDLRQPILRVVHEYNGDWQFLTGDQGPEDIKIVALQQLVLRDDTLNEIFDLGYGEEASRESLGARWARGKLVDEEDSE